MFASRLSLIQSLADLSINLASGWLGVLLISPGFTGVSFDKYTDQLIVNLPPAIITFAVGWILKDKGGRFEDDQL